MFIRHSISCMKIWIGLAGDREFALRFPSVFASILMIPVAWAAGRRLREPAAAWAGAILTAASPLYLWYAQEARMYALLALESALLLFLLLPSGRGASLSPRRQIAALMTLLAMILTHYTAFLLVPALGLWALAQPRRDLRRVALGLLIPLLPLGLAVPVLYQRLTSGLDWVYRDYFFVPLNVILTDLLRASAFGLFPYGDPRSWPLQWLWVGMIGVGIWTLSQRMPGASVLLLGVFFGPPLGLYALSYLKPVYQNIRYLFVSVPSAYLLASVGLAALARRSPWGMFLPGIFLLIGMLFGDYRYFADPYPLKDDWRGALAWVGERAALEDLIILQDLQLTTLAGVLQSERRAAVADRPGRGGAGSAGPPAGGLAPTHRADLADRRSLLGGSRPTGAGSLPLAGPPGPLSEPGGLPQPQRLDPRAGLRFLLPGLRALAPDLSDRRGVRSVFPAPWL